IAAVRPAACADVEQTLATARRDLQEGRYDQAAEHCRSVLLTAGLDEASVRLATIGLSAAYQARGAWELALEAVQDGLKQVPQDAVLRSRLAELQYLRGEFAAAEETARAALQIDENQILARLVQSHVLVETGRLDEAVDGYRWCVRYYNRVQPTDAETLLLVAEGSLQYARWKSVSSIFDFVINTLCPDALADDPHCWQAAHLSGALLLEKYNRAQAILELKAALQLNPHAAEVLVSLGEASLQESEIEEATEYARRAIRINPRLPAALQLAAEIALVSGDTDAAMQFVEPALSVNARDQITCAQQVVVFLLEDGIPDAERLSGMLATEDSATVADDDADDPAARCRFENVWREIRGENPRPGVFLTRIGHALDARRKYAAAEVCYRRAIELMPQLAEPRTELAMLFMRTGNLEEAATMLDDAFRADPYHVRVSNMRKVVRQLEAYDVIPSAHFVIRVPQSERVLGEEMSRYLERTYEELTKLYGFEPASRTPFEVYGAASGQSAHQWFSARMVGLPWVQTIGASTGLIVALASPHDQPEPFNWARVVRHEFVHVLTLQQTDFNIPHWYTEALAVRTEGVVPESWELLLLERVPAGDVFTLEDINGGFTRPENPTDWNMAYCQSWLYAQYIAARFGESALLGLIDCFRRGQSTPEAIAEACGVEMSDFEQGYTRHQQAYVDRIKKERFPLPPSIEAATERWRKHPNDRDAWADVAWALQHAGEDRKAHHMAMEIHTAAPSQPLAVAIITDDALDAGRLDDAARLLQPVFDANDPHPAILERMARLRSKQQDWPAARALWEQGVDLWPREPSLLRGLAAVLLRLEEPRRLREVLQAIAERDADDGLVRKKLAHLATDAADWETAIRWGEEALHCDVRDASVHRLLAAAYEQAGDAPSAARHAALAGRLEQQK
ncbi:MAG: tetratricopeptide repeat protein, partial [Planctomycetaceae bacterium]|nr:tetratricopeptide repeat protein [Planctomycetaceae bacterium]